MTSEAKLVTGEHPLLVLPQLAAAIGLNEAIILQQIHYWLGKQSGRIIDGIHWIYNTYEKWQAQFPFLGLSAIRRAIARLEGQQLILTERHNQGKWDQTKWYTIDYEKLKALRLCICPSRADRTEPNEQNEPDGSDSSSISPETSPESTADSAAAPKASAQEKDPTPHETAPLPNQPKVSGDEPKSNSQEQSSVVSENGNNSHICSEAIQSAVEAAGIRVNNQLKATLLQFTLEQVQAAVAHYKAVVNEKGRRNNPPGWLTDCLRGEWWKSASTNAKDEYPDGFEDAYQRLIAAGVVEDIRPSDLPRIMGDIEVRVINPNAQPGECPYGLMWWVDAVALLENEGLQRTMTLLDSPVQNSYLRGTTVLPKRAVQ